MPRYIKKKKVYRGSKVFSLGTKKWKAIAKSPKVLKSSIDVESWESPRRMVIQWKERKPKKKRRK